MMLKALNPILVVLLRSLFLLEFNQVEFYKTCGLKYMTLNESVKWFFPRVYPNLTFLTSNLEFFLLLYPTNYSTQRKRGDITLYVTKTRKLVNHMILEILLFMFILQDKKKLSLGWKVFISYLVLIWYINLKYIDCIRIVFNYRFLNYTYKV